MSYVTHQDRQGYRWVQRHGSRGNPYWTAERIEMSPRIPAGWLATVVFIYRSEDEARNNEAVGATGFIVRVDVEIPGVQYRGPHGSWPAFIPFHYIVTNAHVPELAGDAVVRFNLRSGGSELLAIRKSEWFAHPEGDDVAVAPLVIDNAAYLTTAVPSGMLLPRDHPLAPGDECFFLGRHIGLDGKEQNTPSARFGNISMIKADPIWQKERHFRQQSLVVEARSLGGFSGSPVFAYTTDLIGHLDLFDKFTEFDGPYFGSGHGPFSKLPVVVPTDRRAGDVYLLGIDWGHMGAREAVYAPGFVDLPKSDRELALNSGMMLVVPGWKIAETLNRQELVDMRREVEEQVEDEPSGAVMDSAEREDEGRVSLSPLDPAEALRGLLGTPKRDRQD